MCFLADFSNCCTFEITVVDSQFVFLWCTPLQTMPSFSMPAEMVSLAYHSPMWKTLGPRTTMANNLFLRQFCDMCCNDQSQLQSSYRQKQFTQSTICIHVVRLKAIPILCLLLIHGVISTCKHFTKTSGIALVSKSLQCLGISKRLCLS